MTGIDLDQHHFPVKCHQLYSLSLSFYVSLSFTRAGNPGRVRVSLYDRREREREEGGEARRGEEKKRLTRGTKGRGKKGENY